MKRPKLLLVIDPEDRDQVSRVTREIDLEFVRRGWSNDSGTPAEDVVEVMQAALRHAAATERADR